MFPNFSFLAASAALLSPVVAQSSCNPTKGQCAPDPALGKAIHYDFTQGSSTDFSLSTGAFPTFNSSGAEFSIINKLDSPTMSSNWYIMYGHYDIVAQIAPGQGAVSSSVLMSDTHDEVDLEWIGSQSALQCNFFGQGQEGSEQTVSVDHAQSSFHTYTIDWTPKALTWIIDGKTVRTISSSDSKFPTSPAQLKIGTWPGGDPSEPSGTIAWAGGPIDYTKGPYTMTVKSVTVWDYSTGSSYSYSDTSGKKIASNGGTVAQYSNTNGMTVTTASMSGSSATPSPTSSSTAVSSSTSSSAAAGTSTSSTPVADPVTSSIPISVGIPTASTLSTAVQSATSSAIGGGGSPSPSPTTWGAGPSPTGSGGSGSGSGSSGKIPPGIQAEIDAISKKNPALGQILEKIWTWIASVFGAWGSKKSH